MCKRRTDASGVETSPSVCLQSTRLDAYMAGGRGISNCLKIGGSLPESARTQTVHARFSCAGGVLTLYLRPGDSLTYIRSGTP